MVVYLGDDLSNPKTLLMYLKVFFHEFTHVFLNNAKQFDDLLRVEQEKYKDQDISFQRIDRPIKELICMAMTFAIYDFGLAFNFFGWQENMEIKKAVLGKNAFFSITYDFLNTLIKSVEKDKLEKSLETYVEDLIKAGLLKAGYKDLYKI